MPVPTLPGEKWALIEGTQDYYISNKGRVKRKTHLLKQAKDRDGYYTCNIFRKRKRVNILVAKAFVPNPDPIHFDVVDHKNNNKEENTAENLQWTTRRRNSQMAHEDNLIPKSQKTDILAVDKDHNAVLYNSQTSAARATGANLKAINKVLNGTFTQTKGFRFIRIKTFIDKRGQE